VEFSFSAAAGSVYLQAAHFYRAALRPAVVRHHRKAVLLPVGASAPWGFCFILENGLKDTRKVS